MLTAEQKLLELYISNVELIGEGFSPALNKHRREFMELLNLHGLPTKRDERYRLNDIRALLDIEREYYFTPMTTKPATDNPFGECGMFSPHTDNNSENTASQQCIGHYGGLRIELTNGFSEGSKNLDPSENGVICGSLQTASIQHEALVMKYHNSVANNKEDSLTALNSAFFQDGAFIYIPDGVAVEKPFVIDMRYHPPVEGETVASFVRSLIIAGNNSSASIVVIHHSGNSSHFLVNSVREMIVGDGANIQLSEFVYFNSDSYLLQSSYSNQGRESVTDITCGSMGGALSRMDYTTNLCGEHGETKLYGLYLNTGNEFSDLHVQVNHLVADCHSYELIKGVVSGNATGSFTGKVMVAPDAQRTNAYQQSRSLQLSETSHAYANPQLEIYADDVKCSHGATIGQLDNDAIYYMRQRGISLHDAKRLQLEGFINDVILHCQCGCFCGVFDRLAAKKIGEM